MGMPNFENRTLFQGDNLPHLQGINSETVDLIATDPPFNKSKDFHATPNSLASGAKFQDRWSWKEDVQLPWLMKIEKDEPEVSAAINAAKAIYGDDMAAFLCWLGVRLMECHRILKPTGSLYLHIDHTAHAYAKMLLDAIFGRENFRNEIIWAYTGPGSPGMRQFNRKHDTLLWYAKGDTWIFNKNAVRIPYKDPQQRPRKAFDTGNAFDKDSIAAMREQGKVLEDWWQDIAIAKRSPKENTGYPTQKPLKIYERIITASSNPRDFVFDPFCGCATTPVAAENLERQWIGMDLWDGCHGIILDRLNKEKRIWKPGDIKLVTVPPLEPTTASMPRNIWKCRIFSPKNAIRLRAVKSPSCLPMAARSVKAAGGTILTTPGCWKWTINGPRRRAARTPTTT